jgi:hypothetical protein
MAPADAGKAIRGADLPPDGPDWPARALAEGISRTCGRPWKIPQRPPGEPGLFPEGCRAVPEGTPGKAGPERAPGREAAETAATARDPVSKGPAVRKGGQSGRSGDGGSFGPAAGGPLVTGHDASGVQAACWEASSALAVPAGLAGTARVGEGRLAGNQGRRPPGKGAARSPGGQGLKQGLRLKAIRKR